MTLRIHALLVGDVVAALRLRAGRVRSARPREGSTEQADACPDRGALRVAADCRASESADGGAHDRACYAATLLLARGRLPTALIIGILPANSLVGPELIEALAGTR